MFIFVNHMSIEEEKISVSVSFNITDTEINISEVLRFLLVIVKVEDISLKVNDNTVKK